MSKSIWLYWIQVQIQIHWKENPTPDSNPSGNRSRTTSPLTWWFSFDVKDTMIAILLFTTCWDILWWINKFCFEVIIAVITRVFYLLWAIKTIFLFKYYMQWLQEYCFLHVGTSNPKFFWWMKMNWIVWSIIWSDDIHWW